MDGRKAGLILKECQTVARSQNMNPAARLDQVLNYGETAGAVAETQTVDNKKAGLPHHGRKQRDPRKSNT
jgi:hypothetical protein